MVTWTEVPPRLSYGARFLLNAQEQIWAELVDEQILEAAKALNVHPRWLTTKPCLNCGGVNTAEGALDECCLCGADLSEVGGELLVEFNGIPTVPLLLTAVADRLRSLGLPNRAVDAYLAFDGRKLVLVDVDLTTDVLIGLIDQFGMPLVALTTKSVDVRATRFAANYTYDLQAFNLVDFFDRKAFQPYLDAHAYLEGRTRLQAISTMPNPSIGFDANLQGQSQILRDCYKTLYAGDTIQAMIDDMDGILASTKAGATLGTTFALGHAAISSWTTYVEYWTHAALKLLLQDAWKLGKIANEVGQPNYSWPDGVFFTYSHESKRFIMYMYDVTIGDTHLKEAEQAVGYIQSVRATINQEPDYYYIITLGAPSPEKVNGIEKFWHSTNLTTQLAFITIEQLLTVVTELNKVLFPWESVFSSDLNLLLNRQDADFAQRGVHKSKYDLEVIGDKELTLWLNRVKHKYQSGVYTNLRTVTEIVHGYITQRYYAEGV